MNLLVDLFLVLLKQVSSFIGHRLQSKLLPPQFFVDPEPRNRQIRFTGTVLTLVLHTADKLGKRLTLQEQNKTVKYLLNLNWNLRTKINSWCVCLNNAWPLLALVHLLLCPHFCSDFLPPSICRCYYWIHCSSDSISGLCSTDLHTAIAIHGWDRALAQWVSPVSHSPSAVLLRINKDMFLSISWHSLFL